MTLSQEVITDVVRRSLSLPDRLRASSEAARSAVAPLHAADAPAPHDPVAERRLASWRTEAVRGDQAQFVRRLEWDALRVNDVLPHLNGAAPTPSALHPTWRPILEAALSKTALPVPDRVARCTPAHSPHSVFSAFVAVGYERVSAAGTRGWERLTEDAIRDLGQGLFDALMAIGGQALQAEYAAFRALQGLSPSPEAHEAFVASLRGDGLMDLIQTYPVLARLLSLRVEMWVDAVRELLRRFEDDRADIVARLCPSASCERITAVSSNLSDAHNEGRTVFILTVDGDTRVVYKPKDLTTEHAYNGFVAWLNEHGLTPDLRPIRVLPCGRTHGWVEWVESKPCTTPVEARLYFERAGALLAVAYALDATDMHGENVAAAGAYPVLLDTETVMHPHVDVALLGEVATSVGGVATRHLTDSVLRTGFLPKWVSVNRGRAFDVSGLGLGIVREGASDAERAIPDSLRGGVPTLNGTPLSALDFLDAVVVGFEAAYTFLADRADAILAPGGPTDAFAGAPLRFVFRGTKIYSTLLHRSVYPRYLRDGRDRSIVLESLTQAFANDTDRPEVWPLVRHEIESMERMDVPYFTVATDRRTLDVRDTSIEDCFRTSGLEALQARLRSMHPADRRHQVGLIRASIQARAGWKTLESTASDGAEADFDSVPPLSDRRAREAATRIARHLNAAAIWSTEETATWVGLTFMPEVERYQLQVLPNALFDGVSGVGLFLAAHGRICDDADSRTTARAAFRGLSLSIRAPQFDEQVAARLGIGGTYGWGSIAYAFTRASQLLDDASLLDDACVAASFVTPSLIATDDTLDVCGGAAGAILGLLAVHDQTRRADVLERAVRCGEHLLDTRVTTSTGHRAWAAGGGGPITGFSHGASGIAYALLRLFAETGDERYAEAAREAVAFERAVFHPEAANWPDAPLAPDDAGDDIWSTWCHGATGIGLARVGMLPQYDAPIVRDDLDVAIDTTLRQGGHGQIDHLCCGVFGRVDLLLEAATVTGRSDLQTAARRRAAFVVDRAQRQSSYTVSRMDDTYSISLFQGKAGIGYELLRLTAPDTLPSVLLWN